MSFAFHYNPGQEPPFVIYIAHEDKSRDKHWRPSAIIGFTPALRASGFLSNISPEEFKSLLLLLSFLSTDGRLSASLPQLAHVLQFSQAKTRARFERLIAVRWLEQPIVFATPWNSGTEVYALVPGFIPTVEQMDSEPQLPPLQAVPREVIIEHSRRKYARTREEVEQEIATMMQWRDRSGPPEKFPAQKPDLPPEQRELRSELIKIGLLEEQADDLMKRFDAVRIRRQLAWLPFRMAKNQAGYLIAAVKDDYAAPRNRGLTNREGRNG